MLFPYPVVIYITINAPALSTSRPDLFARAIANDREERFSRRDLVCMHGSIRYKSASKPSPTKSTLRNQNYEGWLPPGKKGRVGGKGVCGGYRCEMFPWGVLRPAEKRDRTTLVYKVLLWHGIPNRTICYPSFVTRAIRHPIILIILYYPVLIAGRFAESRGSHADAKDNLDDSRKLKIIIHKIVWVSFHCLCTVRPDFSFSDYALNLILLNLIIM